MNRRVLVALAALSIPVGQGFSPAVSHTANPLRVAQRTHGLDPSSPIASRVKPVPAAVLELFREPTPPPDPSGTPSPTPPNRARSHVLTGAERVAFEAAIEGLTPLHQRILQERLQAVYVVDAPGMSGTAMTRTMDLDEPAPLFDLIVRGGVLRETVSEWLTTKERTCYDASGSARRVSIEAGALDAIRYVMLHEATHMVDRALDLTPPWRPPAAPDPAVSPFTRGFWRNPLAIAEPYDAPILNQSHFRREGTVLPVQQAQAMYEALQRTPFASLYASMNWSDDLAELVTVSHWTTKLGQPFRIVIRDGEREVFAYEPMASPLVRQRLAEIARFYDER
jgi:hypothetical protein